MTLCAPPPVCLSVQGGITVDLMKMDAVVEVHEEDFYATVEPGVTRTALNSYIRDTGLLFPIGMPCEYAA